MNRKALNKREWDILREMDKISQKAIEKRELEKENIKAWKVIFIAFIFLILALGVSAIVN